MEPIRKVRLSERIIEAIKMMIVEDEFNPGDKFYSENELTKKLQVSRSSIREAIRIMEVSGKVTVKHGKGIFICDSMKKETEAVNSWLNNNEEAIFEHFEVRLMIDPKAAAAASAKADPDDIRRLESSWEEFSIAVRDANIPGLIKCDEEFHLQIAKSTKNRTLYLLMKTMTQSLHEGWLSSLHIDGRPNKTISEHKAIIDAIKNNDAAAAEDAMREHLDNALKDIRSSMNGTMMH